VTTACFRGSDGVPLAAKVLPLRRRHPRRAGRRGRVGWPIDSGPAREILDRELGLLYDLTRRSRETDQEANEYLICIHRMTATLHKGQ
jgi:hypothetical protein